MSYPRIGYLGKMKNLLGKILFGVLWVLVIPAVTIYWAIASEKVVALHPLQSITLGWVLLLSGLLLVIIGCITLSVYGSGLPMSPFPPKTFVSRGVFGLMSHPIYTGACFISIGLSIYFGSASGLWLVSPIFIFGCIAYVYGFEKHGLKNRFPDNAFRPFFSLPAQSDDSPTLGDIISIYVMVFTPWFLVFLMLHYLNAPDSFTFRNIFPVFAFDWNKDFFLFTIPLTLLSPFLAINKTHLREFAVSGLLATTAGFYIMILNGSLNLTFPSFYIIWTIISISFLIIRYPKAKLFWIFLGLLIAYSSASSGHNTFFGLVTGVIVVLFAKQRQWLWKTIQQNSERFANSWKEWDFGWVRILNYGFYGCMAPFILVLLAGMMIGEEHMLAIFIVSISTMIFSGLWAQIIEGSEKLLRPFGFYGGVIGGVVGCYFVSIVFNISFFLILAAFSVAAPLVQATGRLRCLIQGCCHGSLCKPSQGIRYYHKKSRVVNLSNWKGEFVYPTPVYSILANLIYGGFLFKLWFTGTPITLLIGLSFIFNGLSRFVEESYRGEPQTAILMGLKIYQWIAIVSIIVGAFFTSIPSPLSFIHLHFGPSILAFALLSGLVALFLAGVDFPKSNKRFSRLV